MVDSSEKVSFLVDMQCSSLRAEAFLVFNKGSQPTLGQQITDMRPTVGRQTADKRPTAGRKGGKRQSADSRPTVFWGSCSSLFPYLELAKERKTKARHIKKLL